MATCTGTLSLPTTGKCDIADWIPSVPERPMKGSLEGPKSVVLTTTITRVKSAYFHYTNSNRCVILRLIDLVCFLRSYLKWYMRKVSFIKSIRTKSLEVVHQNIT